MPIIFRFETLKIERHSLFLLLSRLPQQPHKLPRILLALHKIIHPLLARVNRPIRLEQTFSRIIKSAQTQRLDRLAFEITVCCSTGRVIRFGAGSPWGGGRSRSPGFCRTRSRQSGPGRIFGRRRNGAPSFEGTSKDLVFICL